VVQDLHVEIIQVKEKREKRHTQVGFNIRKPQESVGAYQYFCIGFMYTSVGHRGDSHRNPWVIVGKFADIHRSRKRQSQIPRKVCQN
jgi:hypothetical protein